MSSPVALNLPAGIEPPRRLAVRLTAAGERALRQGHPWIFGEAVVSVRPEGRAGDLAIVFDRQRRFAGMGLYDPDSPVRIRLLHHGSPQPLERAWWEQRLDQALARREGLRESADTSAWRVLHGENDRFPALVLDRYDRYGVLKLYSAAWLPWLPALLPLILARLPLDGLLLRTSRLVRPRLPDGWREGMALMGSLPAGPVLFRENGLRFEADLRHGQKTGHFLDQRENRARVRDRVRQAGSREVLDLFSCTGGFALHAAAGGARRVVSVDVSEPALATARRNFAHNQELPAVRACAYETVSADLFALGTAWQQAGRQFDFVIADPPALAQKQADIPRALAAYERLVRLVLPLVRPGGQVLLASCSSRISAETFFTLVEQTAASLGRPLHDRITTAHATDHPVGFAEGVYLKALFARVS